MLHGSCAPAFTRVREEFERNLAERSEAGAAVCIMVRGETVVDLWGGQIDPADRPWQEDTIALVWSCTKGATALCAHILADRGVLDFNAPVSTYWPEFAQADKAGISVRMLLNHSAGLAAISEPLPEGAFLDWSLITAALERQAPLWEPGTRHGYHGLTFGHLVGEVVRRVSGKTIGAFLRDEVAGPLGADVWIGLPEEHEARVAPNIPQQPPAGIEGMTPLMTKAMLEPGSVQALMMLNNGGLLMGEEPNSRRAHAAELPASGGIANARGLASMYRPLSLDGAFDGVRLVSPEAIPLMSRAESSGYDVVGMGPSRFGLGFMKPMDNRAGPPNNRESALMGEDAFGHVGFGGSTGFADPRAHLSFGYTTNRQKSWQIMCDRAQALTDAAYGSIGWRFSERGGVWYEP